MKIYMNDNLCTIYKLNFHRLSQYLANNYHQVVDDPKNADAMIAGVCAAFDADENRSIALLVPMTQENKPTYIIGCMVKVNPERLPSASFYASWEYGKLIADLVPAPRPGTSFDSLPTEFRTKDDYRIYNLKKQFVGVSWGGCAFECSYCPHKLGAGLQSSRKQDDIIEQVLSLIDKGTETIVLTALDTASYGFEWQSSSFARLLLGILEVIPKDRQIAFHIAQFNPEGINKPEEKELMTEACSDPRVKDIQFPIQTTSPRLLKLMNRHYDISKVEEFIVQVRERNSKLYFRTDLLVGFPTETEDELDETLSFTNKFFNEVAVYGYEHKKGTPISDAGTPCLDSCTITQRTSKAIEILLSGGLNVHSGGQKINTLLKSDIFKEKMKL